MAFRFSIGFFSLAMLAAVTLADAQERRSSAGSRDTVERDTVIIGYVPAHEKQARRRHSESAEAPRNRLRNEPTREAGTTVEPASYQEPAEESRLVAPLPVPQTAPQTAPESAPLDPQVPATGHAHIEGPYVEGPYVDGPYLGDEIVFSDGLACDPLWYGRAEYLLWKTTGMNVPALATSGDAADPLPGAIGEPGTEILFGDTRLLDGSRSGGRFTVGKWLDPCRSCGIEATYLNIGDETLSFAGSNFEFDVLARPFFNTVLNGEDSRLIAEPGVVSGTLDIGVSTEFQSVEVLYRRSCPSSWFTRFDWMVGYRGAELRDRVHIQESTLSLSGVTEGTTIDLFDDFDTRSRFHGAEFGLMMHWRANPCWSMDAVAKLAIGGSDFRADVTGQRTTTDANGNSSTTPGGLLALSTNSGEFRWDEFGAISEVGITLRRDLQCGLSATFGYSLIHWSNVARAGEQIDTTINPTQIPPDTLDGEARPAFPFACSDFTAQGLRFGLEYNF